MSACLDSRKKVCGVCMRKSKNLRKISNEELIHIRRHCFENYNLENMSSVICMSCIQTLKAYKEASQTENTPKRKLPNINYSNLILPKQMSQTRLSTSTECDCSYCKIAKLNGAEYTKYEKTVRSLPGRPNTQETSIESPKLRCSVCFTIIAPGIPHRCSRQTQHDNILKLVKTKISKEQLASKILDELGNGGGDQVQTLSNIKGKPKTVVINPSKKFLTPKPKYTTEDIKKFGVSRNLSTKDMIELSTFLRIKGGRDSVETHFRENIYNENKKLEDMFVLKHLNMKEKLKKDEMGLEKIIDVEKGGVFVENLDDMVKYLIYERGLNPFETTIQLGFDGGQGMLKILLIAKHSENEDELSVKRLKYEDGVCPKLSKLSSVKRVIIVGIVPDCQELHENIETMTKQLDMEAIEYTYSCDLKLYLTLCGKQNASCTHSCVYCTGQAPWDQRSEHLTIGSLN